MRTCSSAGRSVSDLKLWGSRRKARSSSLVMGATRSSPWLVPGWHCTASVVYGHTPSHIQSKVRVSPPRTFQKSADVGPK